ncbi:MAG TPA: DinB superfamily protein, partial [Puia sp.]
MLNNILAGFYERDLRRLIEEINSFKNEENLWKTAGTVKNSGGNLTLHLIGGLSYLIGTNLAHTG